MPKKSDEMTENAHETTTKEKGFYILPSGLFQNVRAKAKIDQNLNEMFEKVFKYIKN